MTGDGTYTYEWDAEGRLKSVNSGGLRSFIYNALGRAGSAELVCNSAALRGFLSIQAAEFKNNSALPVLASR